PSLTILARRFAAAMVPAAPARGRFCGKPSIMAARRLQSTDATAPQCDRESPRGGCLAWFQNHVHTFGRQSRALRALPDNPTSRPAPAPEPDPFMPPLRLALYQPDIPQNTGTM